MGSHSPIAIEIASLSGTSGLSFRLGKQWAGRRGFALIHELGTSREQIALLAHRSCRALEIADRFCGESNGCWRLRFSIVDEGFAVMQGRRSADPGDLSRLVQELRDGLGTPPAPLYQPLVDRRARLSPLAEEAWEANRRLVGNLTDKLGRPVDREIRETVVALLTYCLPTTGSCQGHLDSRSWAPWISVGHEEAPSEQRLLEANRRVADKLDELLSRYDEGSPCPAWQRVIVQQPINDLPPRLTIYGGCRLVDKSFPERRQLLRMAQLEMKRLARFLRAEIALPTTYHQIWTTEDAA